MVIKIIDLPGKIVKFVPSQLHFANITVGKMQAVKKKKKTLIHIICYQLQTHVKSKMKALLSIYLAPVCNILPPLLLLLLLEELVQKTHGPGSPCCGVDIFCDGGHHSPHKTTPLGDTLCI